MLEENDLEDNDLTVDCIASEVIENILGHCDVVSLTVSRAVCSRWRNIANRIQICTHYWRAACLTNIPRISLTELVGQAFGGVGQVSKANGEEYNIDSLVWVDWRGIFAAWERVKKVGKWSVETSVLTSSDNLKDDVVTKIKVTGDHVVTGHRWGSRRLWHKTDQVQCPGDHVGSVTDLALVDLLHDPPYQSGMRHHALISTGTDGNIIMTVLLDHLHQPYHDKFSIKIRQHQRTTSAVSILGSLMSVVSEDNVVSLWSLSAPPTELELPDLMLLKMIPGPAEDLLTTRLWPNNLVFWMQKLVSIDCRWQTRIYPIGGEPGMRKQWDGAKEFTLVRPVSAEERKKSGLITIRSNVGSHGENETVEVVRQDWDEAELGNRAHLTQLSHAMVFHDNMYAILSGHQMFLSVDGIHYRHYNTFPHLHATITAIALYAQFLALGTSNGRVHIYHLPAPTQLLFLDLTSPAWRGTVARSPVTSLSLADTGERLVLAVAAGKEVNVTKWFSECGRRGGGMLEVKDGLGQILD